MAKTIMDDKGNEINAKYLDPVVVERHKMVEKLMSDCLKKEKELKAFKQKCFDTINAYLDKTASKYGTDWQGNASLTNFSNTMKISYKVNKMLIFDERLNIAKSKIDEYLKSKIKDSDDELRTIVLRAFQVDKKGNVDYKQIISLKQYKINNPLWIEAIKLIDDAMSIVGTKEYMQFFVRRESSAEWETVILNFSAMGVE